MKNFYMLLISITSLIPLQGMQEQRRRESCCSQLSSFAYEATSWCGRNDYLYLANANALWYMRMKLKRKEQIKDINCYYLRGGAIFNRTDAPIYLSPLHEAVQRGHLQAVIMLCNAGADKTLTIKSHIESTEAAEQWNEGGPWCASSCSEEEVQQKVKAWNEENSVGLSALELAETLSKKPENSDDQERKLIYQFLKDGKID